MVHRGPSHVVQLVQDDYIQATGYRCMHSDQEEDIKP